MTEWRISGGGRLYRVTPQGDTDDGRGDEVAAINAALDRLDPHLGVDPELAGYREDIKADEQRKKEGEQK